MIPNLFILNSTGEIIIEKQWFGKTQREVCDLFVQHVTKGAEKSEIPPVLQSGKYIFFHTFRNGLFFVTVVEGETTPAIIFEAHQCIIDTFIDYFKTLQESNLRENFTLVYQLLDEMIQGGFPYTIEPNQLHDMISPPSLTSRVLNVFGSTSSSIKDDSASVSSKIPWRRDEVKYLKNAVYFDIVESIDATINADGNVVSSIVHGEVQSRCQLSGTPDLTLSLTRRPPITDCSLHRCVRLARYERDGVLSFVPPDGEFTLCSYRISSGINIPIYVRPDFVWTQDTCKFTITVGQRGDFDNPMYDLAIVIPIPRAASTTTTHPSIGTVKTDQLTHTCRWEIPSMPKDSTPTLTGTFTLTSSIEPDERPTIRALFNMKKYSASGMNIDGLVIKNVSYTPVRGVRAITKGGRFYVRTQ